MRIATDEFLPDAAGADKAHHRGFANVDLEAQQRIAGDSRPPPAATRANRMQDSQLAPVERTPSTGFMSAFSTISENSFPSAPVEWIAIASTPAIGPRPKAMTKISANTMPGTVRANSSRRRMTKRSHGAGEVFWASEEVQCKGKHRPDQGADIADQNGLAEHPQPFAPAPEPLAEIAPHPRAVFQRQNAVEIADEVSEIGEQRAQIHFRADRRDDKRGKKTAAASASRNRLRATAPR